MSKSSPRAGAVVVAVVIVAALAWWLTHRSASTGAADAQAVPVTTAAAREGSFDVTRSQPGTVVPSNSVVVRSRVDGELTRVAFTGGQQVKKGDVLAELDPRSSQAQLELANGDLARSQAQLSNAQETLKHYQALLTQDSISRQRVADQQALVRQYAGDVKSAQGRIGTANLQVSGARITAPISGTVGLRRVDPGNLVGPGDAQGIATITQSQPSKVTFAVSVQDAPQVLSRLRGGACIPVAAYGDDTSRPLATGRLLAANNQVDTATGTVRLEAGFANTDNTLLANQFVTAKLVVEALPSAILVPTAAIQQGAQGAFVYVVQQDKTVKAVPVETGPSDTASTVIRSGIAAGAQVVVEGADRLRSGTTVNATAAPEAPAKASAAIACPADAPATAASAGQP
jgi:membrane fusion protein, multidrug efflux system